MILSRLSLLVEMLVKWKGSMAAKTCLHRKSTAEIKIFQSQHYLQLYDPVQIPLKSEIYC